MKGRYMEPVSSIVAAMNVRFPLFPVSVQESPEDDKSLWLCVFAVPAGEVRAVKNYIYALQQELFPDGTTILLPMVKNAKITEEHYPEFLRLAENARLQATARQISQMTHQWTTVYQQQVVSYDSDYSGHMEFKLSERFNYCCVTRVNSGSKWEPRESSLSIGGQVGLAEAA